jgi:ssDNA-binding Zn-finger/Zn-ribbon topoisomerase 1
MDKDFMATVRTTMRDAAKLKAVMVKKNLTRAKAKCPECEGFLVGFRSPYNGHMHMRCTGPCKRQMME